MTQRARIDVGKKVAAFDEHVRRNGQHFTGTWREQRAVVADAEWGARRGARAPREETVDQ